VNRKKGSDATVDINESNNGASVKIFIIQVAALSCAATQVPEIIPLQRQPGVRVSGILFINLLAPVIVGGTRNSLWNATMVRRRKAWRAFTPRAGRSS
jgi:hypothetical protein